MSLQPNRAGGRPGFATLSLDYPISLGVFEKYEDAQKAVDTLSDEGSDGSEGSWQDVTSTDGRPTSSR